MHWGQTALHGMDLDIVVSIYQDGGLAGGMQPVCIHDRLRSRLQLLHMLQGGNNMSCMHQGFGGIKLAEPASELVHWCRCQMIDRGVQL